MRPKPSPKYNWVKISDSKHVVYHKGHYNDDKNILCHIEHVPRDKDKKDGFGSFDVFWVYFGTAKVSNIPVGLKDLEYAKETAEKKIASYIRELRMEFAPNETGDEKISDTLGLNNVTETLRAHDKAFTVEPLTKKEKEAFEERYLNKEQYDVRITDISAYHPKSYAGIGKILARLVKCSADSDDIQSWKVFKKWANGKGETYLAGYYPSIESAVLATQYWCVDSMANDRNLTAKIKLRLAEIDAELSEEQIKIVRTYMKPVLDYVGYHNARILPLEVPKTVYKFFQKSELFERFYKDQVIETTRD